MATEVKIGLGTAQLGLDYGIANRRGRPDRDAVRAILDQAAEHGIRVLDTSPAYGDAELRIGELSPAGTPFSIVTKTPELDAEHDAPRHVEGHLRESLRRLDTPQVYGLLAHAPDDLLGPRGAAIYETLCRLRAAGMVSRIGVSVYTGEQIDAILRSAPSTHGPDHVIEVGGVDIVIDHDHPAVGIGAGVALRGDQTGLF